MTWHLAAAALLGLNCGYCLNSWVNNGERRWQTVLFGAYALFAVLYKP
jgi:hypothetical protein